MITVDVVVEMDSGTLTLRMESAAELAAGMSPESAARCLVERASAAAAHAVDPPADHRSPR
jgi:hypothetical protein